MAKSGIPYFPLDCQLDEKFELIEAEFGLTGFAVVVKLYQRIYGQQGYYCEYTNEVALLFAKSVGLGGKVVSEIVSASIKRGIFDKKLFEKYEILTSKGIQERYFEAVSRRKSFKVKSEYLLLDCAQIPKNVDISSENVYISNENVYISKQSKEEKSRVKESKEEYAPPQAAHAHAKLQKHQYGEFKNVLLTDDEYSKLSADYQNSAELVTFLDEYIEMKGYKAKSHYLAIKKWVVNAVDERKQKSQPKPQQSSKPKTFAEIYKEGYGDE